MKEVNMRERKKETTKTNILFAAISLINERGFAETTMQHIAIKADVSLRTLYNYFPSKEAIVATYMRSEVEGEKEKGMDEVLRLDSTYQRLKVVCHRWASWVQENPVLTKVYASDPTNYCYSTGNDDIPSSGLMELACWLLELGQKAGDVTREIPASTLARHFLGVFYFAELTWLSDTSQSVADIFDEELFLFWRAVRADGVDPGSVIWGMFC